VVGIAVASFAINKSGAPADAASAQVTIQRTSKMTDVALRQLIPLSAQKTYRLSFWAKASTRRCLALSLIQDKNPWGSLGLWKQVQLSSKWQKFEFVFTATAPDPTARFSLYFGDSNAAAGTVSVDAVTMSQ
jgi:hypothetical protein